MSQQESPSDVQSGFVNLPDDLLIRILGQLDLVTQVTMTHVHIRFLMVMPQVWRNIFLRNCFYSSLPDSEKDARFFLGSNQKTFKELTLRNGEYMNIFTEFVYPNVHAITLCDDLIPKMTKSFPNLRSLTLFGTSETGKHFHEFAHLENLLLYTRSFEVRSFLRVLKACKLKTLQLKLFEKEQVRGIDLPLERIKFLEVLKCNPWEIKWFLKYLNNLIHLKELSSNFVDQDLMKEVLTSVNKKSIKSLELCSENIDFFEIINTFNVQIQTVKVSDSVNFINKINNHSGIISWERMGIKHLYLRDNRIYNKASLDKLLYSFKTPDVLGLTECKFYFTDYTFDTQKIVRGRSTTLHIYLYDNTYRCPYRFSRTVPIRWTVKGQHKLLEVHREEYLNIRYSLQGCTLFFD